MIQQRDSLIIIIYVNCGIADSLLDRREAGVRRSLKIGSNPSRAEAANVNQRVQILVDASGGDLRTAEGKPRVHEPHAEKTKHGTHVKPMPATVGETNRR
jgi:hypothetical protein